MTKKETEKTDFDLQTALAECPKPEWYKKARQDKKDKRQELLNSVLSDKLNGMTRNQMAEKYNTTPNYITNLLTKAGYRKGVV